MRGLQHMKLKHSYSPLKVNFIKPKKYRKRASIGADINSHDIEVVEQRINTDNYNTRDVENK